MFLTRRVAKFFSQKRAENFPSKMSDTNSPFKSRERKGELAAYHIGSRFSLEKFNSVGLIQQSHSGSVSILGETVEAGCRYMNDLMESRVSGKH